MKRTESFDVDGPARIDVDNASGSVELQVGAESRVVVTIDGAGVDEWDIVQVGNSVSVRRSSERGWRSRQTRVHVEAPVGSDLEISTASADVRAVGEFGGARIRTASGSIDVEKVEHLDVATASGDVRADTVAFDVGCTTVSGRVRFGTVGGRLHVSTASGGVRVQHVIGEIEASTASGSVDVGCCDGPGISAKCVSGDVSIGLPSGIRVEPDIRTLSGRTRLPERSVRTESDAPRRSVAVRLRTVSGNITIERVPD